MYCAAHLREWREAGSRGPLTLLHSDLDAKVGA
jgi:hypothetical protein